MSLLPDSPNFQSLPSISVDKSSSSSKEPALVYNMLEFRELKRLETAGDRLAVQELKKKVRQRMQLELTSDPTNSATSSTIDSKKIASSKLKSTASAATSSPSSKFPVKSINTTAVNHKRTEITMSSHKNANMVSTEDKKASVNKTRQIPSTTEKHKEKSKSSLSTSKINHDSKGKAVATSTSKCINGILLNNKSRQSSGKMGIKKSTGLVANKLEQQLEKCIERWKSVREGGGKYRPLELFLTSDISMDKNSMVTVEKIAKEFELERLKRLLHQDKEKPNSNKKLIQKKIDHLKEFGKNYTRLEIAAARNEKGPRKDQQIRDHISFLNEKKIIKNKKVTPLDVIQDPYYLKEGLDQSQGVKQNNEKLLQRKDHDLEKKRKLDGTWNFKCQEKLNQERNHKVQQVQRKIEKPIQKRQQESISEMKRRQAERERAYKDLRSKHGDTPNKISSRNEILKSTSLRKRAFDERSEVSPSSRAPKRRDFGNRELDICKMDEATVNQNMSTIIHQLLRPGRRPMYKIKDDNDDDAMEVSGYQVLREEAHSSRIAKKEDAKEERAEQQRRIKKAQKKKS